MALAAVAAGLGWAAVPESMALPRGGPTELPPVTLSTTVLREGESVTISGKGCIDPATSTGSGLVVVLRRPVDPGRGGFGRVVTVQAEVAEDGSYAGVGTVSQPLYPVGTMEATVSCEPPPLDPHAWPVEEPIASTTVTIEVVPSSLPNLTVTAGSPVDVTLPCDVPQTSYGFYGITWPDRSQDSGSVAVSVPGAYPPSPSPKAGDTVTLVVPGNATPGAFEAEARCGVPEAGTSAYYRLGVTVLPASSAAPATPATPAGGAQYTG